MAKRLSVAYSTGDGVEKDPKKALEYIKFYLELGGDAEEIKAAQSEITITTRGGDSGAAEKSVSEAAGDAPSEFSLSSIPAIVYDDSNRQWMRRGIYGDHTVYYNSDGGEVTIYSAQASGSSANTSAGTLHWY